MKIYEKLNELAEKNGTVIFGGGEDINIPLGELKQAFSLKENFYNRSFKNLSIDSAKEIYEKEISELGAKTLLIHIGLEDREMFLNSADEFKNAYKNLILAVRENNPECEIVIVSFCNENKSEDIEKLNALLKEISVSENCEFCDISEVYKTDLKQKKEAVSFVFDTGFVRPLKCRRPVLDLAKLLFYV